MSMMSFVRLTTAAAVLATTGGIATAQTQAARPPAATFPDGARIAFVDLQYVFAASREGKAAATEIQALQARKKADIDTRTKQFEALQQKLAQGGSLLNDETRVRLERDVARAKVDFERLVQDSEAEVQDLQQQFQRAFSRKLFPAIGEVAKSRDLWAVFGLGESNLLWHQPGLDISNEVVTRLDAPADPSPKQ
jgi:Skp family chaperone for outer membrane proteins